MGTIQLKLSVTGVTTPVINTADFKYNKEVAFMTGFDDSLINQYEVAFPIFQSLKYSDGTGKQISFHGTLVSIARIIQESNAGNINIYTWPMVREMLAAGWDANNHTADHGGGPYPWDCYKCVKDAEQIFYDEANYRLIVGTTPAADEGYMYTFKNLNTYLAHNSTYNEGNAAITIYNNCGADQVPVGFFNLDRQHFGDGFTSSDIANAKEYVDMIYSKATGGKKWMGNWLTHGPGDQANFLNLYTYILNHPSNTGGNRLWMPSVAEFLSYFLVKRNSVITHSRNGSELTITINQDAISANVRNLDMSLLVSGFTINSVISSIGADEVTFNSTTGLINIYKKGTNPINPSADIKPAQLIAQIANGSSVDLYYDKPITQSMVGGYSVSGKTVTGITGADNVWKLTCNSAVNESNTLKYKSMNGDAVTAASGLRVCDYINAPIAPQGTTPPVITEPETPEGVVTIYGRNFIIH